MKKKPIKYSDIPPPEPSVVQESPIPHLNVVPKEVGAFDAKTRLSELLELVAGGQSFIITKRGKPVAELKPLHGTAKLARKAGFWPHKVTMAEDFDAPLPEFQEY